MITYAQLYAPVKAAIDAEGSDRYLPDQDIIPAFNYAIRRAGTAYGWAMAERKAPEEALREITHQAILQTNSQGGIWLDDPDLGYQVWNVLAITAEAGTTSAATTQPLPADKSKVRTDLSWDGTGKPTERVTLEEVTNRLTNMFLAGNEVIAANAKLRRHAYYIIGDASTTSGTNPWNPGGSELRVIPKSINKSSFINLSYLQAPGEFVTVNDSVKFPQSMINVLADWAMEFLEWKVGDRTTLHSVAQQDAGMLFQMTT